MGRDPDAELAEPNVPELTVEQLTIAFAAAVGVALLAFVLSLALAVRLRKLRREYAVLRGDGEERDIFRAVARALHGVRDLEHRTDEVVAAQQELSALGRFAVQKFALVRYNAFEDMGGQLSFSAAFLDDHGDGIVLTSINGRSETRTYAKPVKDLGSPYNLSPEEREAIEGAASGFERGESEPATSRSR